MVTNLKKDSKCLYVDTNFILDCTEGRNDKSIVLMSKIKENNWRCITSAFTIMEISEVKKDETFVYKKLQKKWSLSNILRERYKKDLNNDDFKEISQYIKNKIINSYPIIETINLPEEGWTLALEISTNSNIPTGDAIHLASAWNSKCNFLVTSDKPFISNARDVIKKLGLNMEIINPEDFLKKYCKV
jgi:predicted nucleic acid-binding protein